MESALYNTEQL